MYSLIIQCLLVTVLLAGNSNAQVQSINEVVLEGFELKDSSIKDALIKIEKLTNFNFVYTKSDLPGGVAISFSKSRVTVGEVLLEMSKQAQIKFQQVNNNISVKKINSQLYEKQEKIEVIIQIRTITGKVTSMEDSEGLPGVNVVEKGTSNGTVTDVQGNYSLEVS